MKQENISEQGVGCNSDQPRTYSIHELWSNICDGLALASSLVMYYVRIQGLWSNCPAGCISCPDGDESDGLSCTLLKESHSGSEEFTCEGGEEW